MPRRRKSSIGPGSRTEVVVPWAPRIACSSGTSPPSQGSRSSGSVSPTTEYGMPQGCANSSRWVPKRSISSTAMPAARSRSAQ